MGDRMAGGRLIGTADTSNLRAEAGVNQSADLGAGISAGVSALVRAGLRASVSARVGTLVGTSLRALVGTRVSALIGTGLGASVGARMSASDFTSNYTASVNAGNFCAASITHADALAGRVGITAKSTPTAGNDVNHQVFDSKRFHADLQFRPIRLHLRYAA